MLGSIFKHKKGRQMMLPAFYEKSFSLDVGLGLAEALNAVARFPLTALFEQVDAFETLQYVALNDETADTLETFVL